MKKRYLFRLIFAVIFFVFLLFVIGGFYHNLKSVPYGTDYQSPVYTINDRDIDFLFDLTYTVTSFSISVVQQGFDRSERSSNNRMTDAQKNLIRGLSRGQKLSIIDIRAVGPDNTPMRLSPVIITIN